MVKRYPEFPVDGIVLLDKPEGLSSNFALQKVKRLYQAIKAGHAGTLDPMATGMLPICFGKATKMAEYLLDADKTYQATIQLGSATNTGDKTGEINATAPLIDFSNASFDKLKMDCILKNFIGEIEQIPPMYSAVKHQGKALYKLARRGHEVERESRKVTIYQLELIDYTADSLTIHVSCSKGTYIRVLGEDIAKALGTLGHLTALRRLSSAGFEASQMLSLEALEQAEDIKQFLIPIEHLLPDWQAFEISTADLQALFQGKEIGALDQTFSGKAKLICQDKLVAIADINQGFIQSRKLL
ncbi:MAG: tRNA pseudouridine(55) synthase TruB [Gammaproteobacteria bacterium]|jgi:tRNA pseudouridine55 synthase|nr:tRNA pseudouridine(55) synthase TruB [Gammaproteobacteria bacterium]